MLQLEDARAGRLLLSTELDREESVRLSRCALRAYEGIVIELAAELG
jgi:hypothetical protein